MIHLENFGIFFRATTSYLKLLCYGDSLRVVMSLRTFASACIIVSEEGARPWGINWFQKCHNLLGLLSKRRLSAVFSSETSARFMILFPGTRDTESQCYAIFHGKLHLLRAFLHGVPIHKHSYLISCLINLVLSNLERIFHSEKDTSVYLCACRTKNRQN